MSGELRCSVLFYEGYVDRAPTVSGAAAALLEAGASVQIHWSTVETPGPSAGDDAASFAVGRAPGFVSSLRRLLRRVLDFSLGAARRRRLALRFVASVFYLSGVVRARRHARGGAKAVNLAVDLRGVLLGLFCQILLRQRFVMISLELTPLEAAFIGISRPLRAVARRAMARAAALVIQDRDRLEAFTKLYGVTPARVFLLPNSPRLRDTAPDPKAPNYWRHELGIDAGRFPVIALHAGMLDESMFCRLAARGFKGVPGCALVLHSAVRAGVIDPAYLAQIRAENDDNLFLSLTPAPPERVGALFAAATIGIAYYKPLDANHSQIALASGKIAQCLRHGKPLLVNNLPSLAALIERHQVGVVVRDIGDPAEVGAAVERIMTRYATYSANAVALFERELDFDRNFEPIRAELERLAATAS